MKKPIKVIINGETHELLVDPRTTLLDMLRDEVLLTGAKEGCGNGNCGSCTVLMDGRSVDSCLVFAMEADGHRIETVEGLAKNGKLHPIQLAFIEQSGLQCGICTPGFLMSTKALLEKNPHPTEQEIRLGIAGNLCRCTGYDKIVRSIMAASKEEVRG